jgi:hypothetical protein
MDKILTAILDAKTILELFTSVNQLLSKMRGGFWGSLLKGKVQNALVSLQLQLNIEKEFNYIG